MREQIVAETRGNPLALLELPRGMTPAQLAGGFGLPSMASLSGQIEEKFLQRLGALPHDTQRLLLLAAAEPLGDPALLLGRGPAARDRARCSGAGRAGRAARTRCAGDLPSPAGAFGDVPGRLGQPSAARSTVYWRR